MVATGVFLSTMDSSMINVALPYIMRSFSSSLAKTEWIVLVYLLTISATLLIWGKISDRLGKGTIYLVGIVIFSFGAFCCYFSPNLGLLISSRFIQGVGASMMMSTGPAIIRLVVPPESIGKWLGSLGIATSMGLMCGPLLSGLILHNFSWKYLFLLNVPISLTVFFLGWIHLAGTLPKYESENSSFDWKGCILWVILVGLLVLLLNGYFLNSGFSKAAAAFVTLLCAASLYFHEIRHPDPLLPILLLRQKYFGVAMLTAALSFSVLFFVLILMPFYLNYILGLSFDKIGYMMMTVPVSLFVVSPIAGRLFDRYGARHLTLLGMLVTGGSIYLLSQLTEHSTLFQIGWRMSLLGCGQSIFLSPNTASVLSKVSIVHTGITAGMLATCRNLGMLIGVAMVGLIFSILYFHFSGGYNLKEYTVQYQPAFLQAFRFTLMLASGLAFATAYLSFQRE